MNAMLFRQQQLHGSSNVIHVGAAVSSNAALPGELATTVVLGRELQFRSLCALIDRLAVEGIPNQSGGVSMISRGAAETAKAFLEHAKSISSLPKVGIEDDSVVLAWERGPNTTLVLVETGMLHIVRRAGTPFSTYEENIPFDGQAIPPPVVHSLPMR